MSAWETVDAMALSAGFAPQLIRGPRRKRKLVVVRRRIAIHLEHAGYNSTEIAKAMSRDHTSVLYLLGRTAAAKRRKRVPGPYSGT